MIFGIANFDPAGWDDSTEDGPDHWSEFGDVGYFSRISINETSLIGTFDGTDIKHGDRVHMFLNVFGIWETLSLKVQIGEGESTTQIITADGVYEFVAVADFTNRTDFRITDTGPEAFGDGQVSINKIWVEKMSSAELYSDLISFAGLQALLGNGDSPETYRVYPSVAPQGVETPYLIYQLVSGNRQVPLTDAGGTGVENNLYQLSAFGNTLEIVDDVAEQARLALADSSANEYVPINKREWYETETRLFVVQYDFSQWFT